MKEQIAKILIATSAYDATHKQPFDYYSGDDAKADTNAIFALFAEQVRHLGHGMPDFTTGGYDNRTEIRGYEKCRSHVLALIEEAK